MLSKTCWLVIVVSLVAFLVAVAHGTENGNGYIYDAKGASDNRVVVINSATRYVGIQDKSDVRIDAVLTEFGGYYNDCGNEVFFCLTGPLEIVIPKSMPMKQWQYHGWSCKNLGKAEGDAIRITCWSSRSSGRHGRPTFTYSLSRGVLSIDSSPVGGSRGGFELRGQRGLFSPGSNP